MQKYCDQPDGLNPCDLKASECGNRLHYYLAYEVDARIAELEKALRFYEQEIRYQGPNQREVNGDIYTPAGAVYLQDVTRDRGAIARAALKLGL